MHSSGSCFGWFSERTMIYRKGTHMQGCESTYFCVSRTEVKNSIFGSPILLNLFSVPQQNVFDILVHFVFC